MNELNKDLREQAIHLGLCKDWQRMWRKDWSEDKLIERMYAGLDFCLKHHYPSNEFILKHFSQEVLRKNNVFVNDKYSSVNPKESLVLGKSEISMRFNANRFGFIHVRDNSIVTLTAKNRSFVMVHLYDNAQVYATQEDKSSIVIVKHSANVTIIADSNIKVREEYDYLK